MDLKIQPILDYRPEGMTMWRLCPGTWLSCRLLVHHKIYFPSRISEIVHGSSADSLDDLQFRTQCFTPLWFCCVSPIWIQCSFLYFRWQSDPHQAATSDYQHTPIWNMLTLKLTVERHVHAKCPGIYTVWVDSLVLVSFMYLLWNIYYLFF